MFRLPFAAGNVFTSSMLDTLLYQVCLWFSAVGNHKDDIEVCGREILNGR